MKQIDAIAGILIAALKTVAFFLLITILIPIALLFRRIDPEHPFRIPQFFHFLLLNLLGISLHLHGEPSPASPVLFASNHTSYLDAIVLGYLLPAGFVAKAEVADWPLFGLLSKLQNCVFVERRSTRAAEQRSQLKDYLTNKHDLVLFPEGTSSEGLTALPFKSSLFSLAEDSMGGKTLTVQPVSVTCVELDGFPMLREERAQYGWYGDMALVPHLWNVFQHSSFTVDVVFHTPLTVADYPNRKDLAAACQKAVAQGIKQSLARRDSSI
ncbi:MAG: lysophospholipid acyltransferase family protein [Bdellovibrionales bacterium]